MKRIFAPWRMDYILDVQSSNCFICDILKQDNDRKNLVVRRSELCAVIMNRFPYTNGHLMVAPYKHVAQLGELSASERGEIIEVTNNMLDLLSSVIQPHGFNVGFNIGTVAGAGLKDHIHLHIVPRWEGDTNFMPVLGDVKIIPQSLDELWEKLTTISTSSN
jgi:ATP adenylyltransferase